MIFLFSCPIFFLLLLLSFPVFLLPHAIHTLFKTKQKELPLYFKKMNTIALKENVIIYKNQANLMKNAGLHLTWACARGAFVQELADRMVCMTHSSLFVVDNLQYACKPHSIFIYRYGWRNRFARPVLMQVFMLIRFSVFHPTASSVS